MKITVYCKPQPQGSSKAFVIAGKARITSANTKLKPYRQEVTSTAIAEMAHSKQEMPLYGKHVPVRVSLHFYFLRPASAPKKRIEMVVKPDLDKNIRATLDSLTGVLYHDDAQIVQCMANKSYGSPERVEIVVEEAL